MRRRCPSPPPRSVPLFQPAGAPNRAVTESSLGPKGESGHFQGGIRSSLSHTGQRKHLLFLTAVREKPRSPAEGRHLRFRPLKVGEMTPALTALSLSCCFKVVGCASGGGKCTEKSHKAFEGSGCPAVERGLCFSRTGAPSKV